MAEEILNKFRVICIKREKMNIHNLKLEIFLNIVFNLSNDC